MAKTLTKIIKLKGQIPGVSIFANKELKSALHMAAVSAAHVKGELAEYYQRKLKERKSKIVI
ncbi:MAG: hypothetical protein AAF335_04415 [Bacteroidota bacterium]